MKTYATKVTQPETAQLNITVEGAPAIIDQLKLQDIQAILDVSNLPPGKHELKVALNLPTYREAWITARSKGNCRNQRESSKYNRKYNRK